MKITKLQLERIIRESKDTNNKEQQLKITKRQLRRIIKEEKAKLLKEQKPSEMSMHDAAEHYSNSMSDKTASAIQLLQTAHANLEDLVYNVDQGAAQEINLQLALIEDAIHALGGVI